MAHGPKNAAKQQQQQEKKPLDAIQLINDWWQERLRGGNADSNAIRHLQDRFVHQALKPIKDILSIGESHPTLITVRSSFCFERQYVRPVYSEPPSLSDFLRKSENQKPFKLKRSNAFDGIEFVFPPSTELRSGSMFVAWHKLDRNADTDPGSTFAGRIRVLVAALSADLQPDPDLRQRAKRATHCFFAGRNKTRKGEDRKHNSDIEVAHLLAIYYKAKQPSGALEAEQFGELRRLAEQLFRGLDLIARIDAALFKSEGLELVAELLPEFARRDMAHADKIAYALERLRRLFTRHMVGRHGGDESKRPSIFYLTTTFEKHRFGFTPRLELYPQVYRNKKKYHNVTYFVGHRLIRTATKFLIWRYLGSTRLRIVATASGSLHKHQGDDDVVVTQADYGDLFNAVGNGTKWHDQINPKPDFLLLTRWDDGGSLWEALQHPAESETHALAAFVVEGKTVDSDDAKVGDGLAVVKRYLPRGIFAIESPYEDGFSDDDIASLRTIFAAIASLIRSISHQHAPIDYREAIAGTFGPDIPSSLERLAAPERLARFLFYTQKLDGDVLQELVRNSKADLDKFPNNRFRISPKTHELLEMIADACPPGGEKPDPEERAKILSTRMDAIQKLLATQPENLEAFLADDLLAFLDACPENFTWASYLRCMAQTLGDRMGPGTTATFSRMKPGFSASGMFMASVQKELRQVVKLSTAEKLDEEEHRYRKWVRYRLVNAARIPTNGFEFETTGKDGMESGERNSAQIDATFQSVSKTADGILVSDLVSGEAREGDGQGKVRTLLDAVANCLARRFGTGDSSLPDLDSLKLKLHAVFVENAALWADPAVAKPESGQIRAIEDAFRIKRSDIPEIDGALLRLRELSSGTLGNRSYEQLMDYWKQRPSQNELSLTARIVHGDMNARNLTWSEALNSFFLIDFEFTGPGILGGDQMKLVVNLTTEVWFAFASSYTHGFDDTRKEEFFGEVNCAIEYLKLVFSELIIPHGRGTLRGVLDRLKDASGSPLASVLEEILRTIDIGSDKFDGTQWRSHWAMMLFAAAVKEFCYSSRSNSSLNGLAALTNKVLEGKRIDDDDLLQSLTERVRKATENEANDQNVQYALLRHVLAGRLLAKLVSAFTIPRQ